MIIDTQIKNPQPRRGKSSSVSLTANLLLIIFGFEAQLNADDIALKKTNLMMRVK